MKKLVRLVSISFSKEEKDAKGQIEKVKEYIYQNLDQDLRRDEIAMEIFVNRIICPVNLRKKKEYP